MFKQAPEQKNIIVFGQVACKMSEEERASKLYVGLGVSCLGLLIVLAYQYTIERAYIRYELNKCKFDLKLLSSEDFTVRIDIPREAWDTFIGSYVEEKTRRRRATCTRSVTCSVTS